MTRRLPPHSASPHPASPLAARQLSARQSSARRLRRATRLALGGLALAASTTPGIVHAQGVLVKGATTVRFLELRPYVDDSVLFDSDLPGSVDYKQLPDGRVVRCISGDAYCRFKTAGRVANALPLMQDLQFTAWGLGRRISLHSDVRIRSAMGSQPALWPRAQDTFDALTAYIQLDRSKFTARAGRQYAVSGLGVYNFDGATMVVRPSRHVTVEGFGGLSLAQALNESVTTSEIATVDELPPDRNAYLVGAQVRVRAEDRGAFNALYQREVRSNRSALCSERIALDGMYQVKHIALEGAYTQDLASNVINEMRLRVRYPSLRQTELSIEARRFRPFFELWTIWGAFAPVGFDETRVQAAWHNAEHTISFDLHGARRAWQETSAGLDFAPLRAEGWRVGGGALWRPSASIYTNVEYSADVGFGASRSEGDVGIHYDRGRMFVGATASAFQSIYEFRVGTARVFGFGADLGWRVNPDVRLVTEATVYRQAALNGAPSGDWNQRRATARFEWVLGADPGSRTVNAAARKAAARAGTSMSRLASSTPAGRSAPLPAAAGSPERRP
ncbi:MAG: hypothetical protein IT354_17225 [Gemmatimonadaceae bacterium]|jgi:hypothetical protein|nr:hypothetical protein [Gemmatimonadaceae bacterium]